MRQCWVEMPPQGSKGKQQSLTEWNTSWLSFPPSASLSGGLTQAPTCSSVFSIFYSMWPREGAQTLPNVKALTVTQCDTDPAQRTPLLRHAGRALISLSHSPSSPSLTQGTKTTNRKWFCPCFESNPIGLLLNQRINPCPGGHWGTLLPPKWTKPANLPVFPCVTLISVSQPFQNPRPPFQG